MASISMRVSDDEHRMIRDYAKVNNKSMSGLIRDAVLDLIEDGMLIDEERILRARDEALSGKYYEHEEVWKDLGV